MKTRWKKVKNSLYVMWDNLHTLFYHRRIIRYLEAQLGKDLEVRIHEFTVHEGTITGMLEHPLFKGFAKLCADLVNIGGPGTGNFITCTIVSDGQRYELTIQKAWGKTSAERINELETELLESKTRKGDPASTPQ